MNRPLVCCRVANMNFVPSAAVFDLCRNCRERVAMSPSSAEIRDSGGVPTCHECFAELAAGQIFIGIMNAGQIADMNRAEEERKRTSN